MCLQRITVYASDNLLNYYIVVCCVLTTNSDMYTLLVGETQQSSYIPYIAGVLQQILTKFVLAACSNYCTHICMRRDEYGMERKKKQVKGKGIKKNSGKTYCLRELGK